MKHILRTSLGSMLPHSIANRTDKMGFPVPLQEWLGKEGIVRQFVMDILSSRRALERPLINNRTVLSGLGRELKFGRKLWGFLCLELWQRAFHDRAAIYKDMLKGEEART